MDPANSRDYSTTLQMRRSRAAPPTTTAACCQPYFGPAAGPVVWACPVHGHVTLPRRHVPRRLMLPAAAGGGAAGDVMSFSVSSPPADSPFYHELDPNAFDGISNINNNNNNNIVVNPASLQSNGSAVVTTPQTPS